MDPVYGYQSVNVEAQSQSPSSLINWLRKLISVRQAYKVFGRGALTFLRPANRKMLAYVREYGDEVVLCVANLSPFVAADRARPLPFAGRMPVEMIGWSAFQAIGDERYVITLPGHAFFWFLLRRPRERRPPRSPAETLPEFVTIVLPRDARQRAARRRRRRAVRA